MSPTQRSTDASRRSTIASLLRSTVLISLIPKFRTDCRAARGARSTPTCHLREDELLTCHPRRRRSLYSTSTPLGSDSSPERSYVASGGVLSAGHERVRLVTDEWVRGAVARMRPHGTSARRDPDLTPRTRPVEMAGPPRLVLHPTPYHYATRSECWWSCTQRRTTRRPVLSAVRGPR